MIYVNKSIPVPQPSQLLTGRFCPVGSENLQHKFGILESKNPNLRRFPAHFMHQLTTTKEFSALKSQIGMSKSGCGVKRGEVGRPWGRPFLTRAASSRILISGGIGFIGDYSVFFIAFIFGVMQLENHIKSQNFLLSIFFAGSYAEIIY